MALRLVLTVPGRVQADTPSLKQREITEEFKKSNFMLATTSSNSNNDLKVTAHFELSSC